MRTQSSSSPFSSPEAALLLVSTKNRDLWLTSGLVQHRKSAIHGLPVTLRMFRVKSDKSDWFWSQSIVVFKAIQKRNVVGPGQRLSQRSRFLVLTKRSAASGDENGSSPPSLPPPPPLNSSLYTHSLSRSSLSSMEYDNKTCLM